MLLFVCSCFSFFCVVFFAGVVYKIFFFFFKPW